MKKRIVCALLTLVMMVSLLGTTVLTASAASAGTSEAAITVLKKLIGKKEDYCYQVDKTQLFRTGYGTVCNEPGHKVDQYGNSTGEVHYISEKQADEALRAALGEIDAKVDAFASSNGLSLTVAQNDALNIFSFVYGTEWMNGTGNLKTVLKSKPGYYDLVEAMKTVGNNMDDRCGVFANMYLNGIYSNNVPTNYIAVTYKPNGGELAQTATPGSDYVTKYDPSVSTAHLVTPNPRTGYIFLGWFTGSADKWVPAATLPTSGSSVTMTAQWQKKNAAYADALKVDYKVKASQLSSKTVYTKPVNEKASILVKNSKNVQVSDLLSGSSYSVDRYYVDGSGNKWVRLAGQERWLILSGSASADTSFSSPSINVTVSVTNSYVNIRKEPSAASTMKGTFNLGAQLRIINTTVVAGVTWGQVANSATDDTPIGWVCLLYTNWREVSQNSTNTTSNVGIGTATVSTSAYVNVRNGAGTENAIVGALKTGDSVPIYEIKTVNGHQWGRTDAGWFCLTYAHVTMNNGSSISNSVSGAGASAYAFSGKMEKDTTARVSASTSVDSAGTVSKGTKVIVTNLNVDANNNVWAKITWNVTKDGKTTVKSGWVNMGVDASLSTGSSPITISSVEYVVSSELTARDNPSSDAMTKFTMNPGVTIKVTAVKIVGETLWGLTSSDVNKVYTEGWVNLASSNVTRVNAPSVPSDTVTTVASGTATITNADVVNVRSKASVTSTKVGTLKRGTSVGILKVSDGWYKIDVDVDGNPETDSWVYKDYIQVNEAPDAGSSSTSTVVNSNGTTTTTTTVGTGIVANTYTGVNVRSGAGIGYGQVGKLLPGTSVEILETVTAGGTKWGRCSQGWVCMDYITMLSSIVTSTTTTNGNGTPVSSFDNVQTSSVTAVYTGKVNVSTDVRKAPDRKAEVVRSLSAGENITMHELVTATEIVINPDGDPDYGTNNNGYEGCTTTTEVTYWARINDGYIYIGEKCPIELDSLNEKVYTLTGAASLNVCDAINSNKIGTLSKGDQVKVTKLGIYYNQVWGQIDYDETEDAMINNKIGWIRLDQMSEGAYFIQTTTTNTTTTTVGSGLGSTGGTGTGTGGSTTVSTGSGTYNGKVVNTNQVNVRQSPSTNAAVTTTLKKGQSLVIYETTIADAMAWGRCDAGWVYLYYVDLIPTTAGILDARVVYNDNTIIYSDVNGSSTVGTYARMSVIDIYEIVGKMARTSEGWVHTDNLL